MTCFNFRKHGTGSGIVWYRKNSTVYLKPLKYLSTWMKTLSRCLSNTYKCLSITVGAPVDDVYGGYLIHTLAQKPPIPLLLPPPQ